MGFSSPPKPPKKGNKKQQKRLTVLSVLSLVVAATVFTAWQSDGSNGRGRCDLYNGRWVRDEEGRHPLYLPGSCPFVDYKFACQENGRKDREYMKWRWKPHGCDLPRFNAIDFLERLRNKVLMLVGDSMSRNQFESLLCLLRDALPDKSKIYETRGYKITKNENYYKMLIEEYNCSVEYHRSYYLVKQGTYLNEEGENMPILHIDRMDESASRWKNADVLVFNTGLWWTEPKTNWGKYFYQERNTLHPKLDVRSAYRRGLQTWARWVEENFRTADKSVDVFLCGIGSQHFRGGSWNSGGKCNKETEPEFERGTVLNAYPWRMRIVEEVIRGIRFPVTLLNVTRMTNFRKDAHPSIYGRVSSYPGLNSSAMQDCSHWCLPGVPDTWNELLYANLILYST